ncbi:MAG: ribosomal protein S18-alanine N-acetyltransferase [Oscillospiraceae bacterium]|jgi:ribosomal-protein-alanine N-acetyltransferase|nr:ribosomal protein S18-alanine N-acetyltransferase [Oscillospiraceae bacterium]
MMLAIRRGTEADLADISAIEREAICPPWSDGTLLRSIYSESGECFVADESGWVVGFAFVSVSEFEAELLQIAVDSTERRRGVGAELLQWTLRSLRQRGVRSVFLEARKSNAAALALYCRFGFCEVGVRRGYYDAPAEDAVVMRLELFS